MSARSALVRKKASWCFYKLFHTISGIFSMARKNAENSKCLPFLLACSRALFTLQGSGCPSNKNRVELRRGHWPHCFGCWAAWAMKHILLPEEGHILTFFLGRGETGTPPLGPWFSNGLAYNRSKFSVRNSQIGFVHIYFSRSTFPYMSKNMGGARWGDRALMKNPKILISTFQKENARLFDQKPAKPATDLSCNGHQKMFLA